ncbi:MAG: B12-binding domain-containing radical SAM protein [Anaerolineae bacterium]|nr:B12-binding domain-containing radical SAM protein [Anaerolineae bacterium]
MRPTVLLYNPKSTSPGKQPLPLSLLSVAAVIDADYEIEIIDGNLVADPAAPIIERAKATNAKLLAVTVMPGPQLAQAVPMTRRIKAALPDLKILWGGYFPTQHADVCLRSGYVDYCIEGQGEAPFRKLVDTVHRGGSLDDVPSLWYLDDHGSIKQTARAVPVPLDNLPWFPYHRIDMAHYRRSNYLGRRVYNHNTSFGCPFACNFCAVVALSKRRWIPESSKRMADIVTHLHDQYGADAIDFHDMDFFVSETRVAEFSERITRLGMHWWGLGRIDTLMGYSDDTWAKMKASGLKMIFMGAESGSDEVLERMNKGGKSGTEQTLAIVERMKHYGVVPELSFVLGNPPDPMADIDASIKFIRKLKRINPATELVLYIYTPVPQENSELFEAAKQLGFRFPETLDEWAGDNWATFALRRDPGTPWFKEDARLRVRNFESVINAYYPTVTDLRLQRSTMKSLLRALSGWRYKLQFYQWPYELKVLQRAVHYRRPETTGF